MKLLYQTHSPYARKVLVMAHEASLIDEMEVIHHETSPVVRNDDVFSANPLGKVPVLFHEGECIFDSLVICLYLDRLHNGPKFVPIEKSASIQVLKLESLAVGMADAGILARWEIARRPEEKRYQPFLDGQLLKLTEAYDFLEAHASLRIDRPTLAEIAIATTLSWTEFVGLPSFKPGRPKLTNWYDAFCQRPSMKATPYSGATQDHETTKPSNAES
jgi:glutathione S-transferase